MKYTHKGWFFMCPVYLNADDGEGMVVDARWSCLDWWFTVNEWIFRLMVFLRTMIDPYYEPAFPFLVTGELKEEQNKAS